MLELFVQLDPRLQEFVALGATLLVSWFFLQLANIFPVLAEYLGQYKASIVVWLTGVFVQLIQAQLNRIPVSWDEVVFIAMKLLAQVLVVLTTFAVLRKVKKLGYKAL